jgi:transcriptional regulator with XRE-family HTH domain
MCRLFGTVLRQLREQAGISLRELGRRCLYDHSRISRVERGEHVIDQHSSRCWIRRSTPAGC